MSDPGRAGRAKVTPIEGGAVLEFTGPDEVPFGATGPRDVSDTRFLIGDRETSAIWRFLMTGHV